MKLFILLCVLSTAACWPFPVSKIFSSHRIKFIYSFGNFIQTTCELMDISVLRLKSPQCEKKHHWKNAVSKMLADPIGFIKNPRYRLKETCVTNCAVRALFKSVSSENIVKISKISNQSLALNFFSKTEVTNMSAFSNSKL